MRLWGLCIHINADAGLQFKTIIDITNLDAEKHAENAAKQVASYSEKLLHHASILAEKEYQKFLLERLEKDNGYVIHKASNFDRYFAVDREMLFKFLEDTQHETMEYLRKIYKQNQSITGRDRLYCILDKKSNQYVRKTRRTQTLHVLFSIYADWVRKRCGTKSSAQEGSTDSHISKVI